MLPNQSYCALFIIDHYEVVVPDNTTRNRGESYEAYIHVEMEDVIIYAELCTLQDELSTLVDDESIILRKRVLVHVLEMDLGKIE